MKEAYLPETLQEALQVRKDQKVLPIAGGTDLMIQHRREGGVAPAFEYPLLFLHKLKELKKIEQHTDQIIIGAGVLLSQLIEEQPVPELLRKTVRQMAAVTTRNVATIGGNICNASPAGDTLPFLYATEAVVLLQSLEGSRHLLIQDFITGPGKTALKEDELLVEIRIPYKEFKVAYYRKVGTRKALALSKISFAGLANFENGYLSDLRMAVGAVAPTVVRSREAEKQLIGLTVEEMKGKMQFVREIYSELIKPIDDARSTAGYRKAVSLDLLEWFVREEVCRGG
ncbi:MAG: FAD binding domain-containing protein [Bacteroidales bacterium]|nr:FAD binding domain-containing protein [Bacteroidales bacterium]